MGQATPLNRDIVFTDASLTLAAARQAGRTLVPEVEAERILKAYPVPGVTVAELAEAIVDMMAAAERAPPASPAVPDAPGNADHGDAGSGPKRACES